MSLVRIFIVLSFWCTVSTQAFSWDSFTFFPPMNQVYHPVSTTNLQAQEYFDRGLLAIYAFNHDAAYRSFEQAAEADPELAMAYWGMALALGENINRPIDLEREKKATFWIQKALSLLNKANTKERAYIYALAKRYPNDPKTDQEKLREAYKNGMREVVRLFPDDLDGATLYCESMMNLRPWRLWKHDGQPEAGTLEIVSVLESVLKRNPAHLGANHYYIHAIEASKHPEQGLMSAYRLYGLLPEWGHILHMPSHIFFLVGDYEGSVQANKQAVAADLAYIQKYGTSGYYAVHYLSHNLFFLSRSYLWQERYENALETAKELVNFLMPHLAKVPELEYYALAPLQVYLYAHDWQNILQYPEPNEDFVGYLAFWHFARAMAFVHLGQIEKAEIEKQHFLATKNKASTKEKLGFNSAEDVLAVADTLLNASIAKAQGEAKAELNFLETAVKLQDRLYYNEPPDWYYPIRQTLGAALMEMKEYAQAEGVFRQALKKLPRNGRSLFGLLESLKKQNKETYWVEREAKEALRFSNRPLSIQNL